MDTETDFQKIGLNAYEARAYEALLRLGTATASAIARNADVPQGKIYSVLHSLENKNLVKIIPEDVKKFTAEDPSYLRQRIQQYKDDLSQLEDEVENFAALYEHSEKEPVLMIQGKQNFYKLEKEKPEAEQFSYDVRYIGEFRPNWVRELKQQQELGVDTKLLFRYDEETRDNVQKWAEIANNIKSFPNQGVALSINEHAVLIALIKSNVSLLIRDQAFIDVMKRMFEATYTAADEIPSNQ